MESTVIQRKRRPQRKGDVPCITEVGRNTLIPPPSVVESKHFCGVCHVTTLPPVPSFQLVLKGKEQLPKANRAVSKGDRRKTPCSGMKDSLRRFSSIKLKSPIGIHVGTPRTQQASSKCHPGGRLVPNECRQNIQRFRHDFVELLKEIDTQTKSENPTEVSKPPTIAEQGTSNLGTEFHNQAAKGITC